MPFLCAYRAPVMSNVRPSDTCAFAKEWPLGGIYAHSRPTRMSDAKYAEELERLALCSERDVRCRRSPKAESAALMSA